MHRKQACRLGGVWGMVTLLVVLAIATAIAPRAGGTTRTGAALAADIYAFDLAISRDGSTIAYADPRGGIVLMANDGSNQRHVTTDNGDYAPGFSPDGTAIVFGRADGGLFTIRTDGTGLRRLTTHPNVVGSGQDVLPVWSSTNVIAFVRGGPGTVIYTVSPDGSNLQRSPVCAGSTFPDPCYAIWGIDWSPDGRSLAVSGSNAVLIGNAATGATTNLTSTPIDLGIRPGRPRFSPDGKTVAFSAPDRFGVNDIATVRVDIPGVTGLTFNREVWDPIWSGDGTALYAVTKLSTLAVMRADGTDARLFGEPPGSHPQYQTVCGVTVPPSQTPWDSYATSRTPGWTRDGKLVFSGMGGVWRMNADGLNPVLLYGGGAPGSGVSPDGRTFVNAGGLGICSTSSDGTSRKFLSEQRWEIEALQAVFSPDGSRIAFTRTNWKGFDRAEIWTMRADGSDLRRVTAAGTAEQDRSGDHDPAWSPDGSRFATIHQACAAGVTGCADEQQQLAVVNADGSGRRYLTAVRDSGLVDEGMSSPSWSPDGTRIVFSARSLSPSTGKESLWVIRADGSGLRQITGAGAATPAANCLAAARDPRWSPDGSRIAFVSACENTQQFPGIDIYTVSPDGTDLKRLTGTGVLARPPCVYNCPRASAEIHGTDGPDVLTGDDLNNAIYGLGGNDTISGLGGTDFLYGGTGDDTMSGGSGNDLISGDDGNDTLAADTGRDTLRGGAGNDRLTSGPGAGDGLFGGTGNDRLVASNGAADFVNCGPGNDTAVVERIDKVVGCEHVVKR